MPEMGAEDCIKALRKLNGSIPIILSTGYAPAGKVKDIIDNGCRFIQKPYSIRELSEVIAMELNHGI